jgi:hypothetical protein
MHVTPELTPAALRRWERMDSKSRELILDHIWCGSCGGLGIRDASGWQHRSGDIMLSGSCPTCGHKVARLIETGDTMGPADESP